MPYFIFKKPRGTANWKLLNRFETHTQGCTARDSYAAASENVVVRMIKADTEGEARGKTGVVWNSLANDLDR